jgi:hypothetical protein
MCSPFNTKNHILQVFNHVEREVQKVQKKRICLDPNQNILANNQQYITNNIYLSHHTTMFLLPNNLLNVLQLSSLLMVVNDKLSIISTVN